MTGYTTESITMTIGRDLTDSDVYVCLVQDSQKLEKKVTDKTYEDGVTTLVASLTQAETGRFNVDGSVSVMLNWINASGMRGASDVKVIPTFENLMAKVIQYGA